MVFDAAGFYGHHECEILGESSFLCVVAKNYTVDVKAMRIDRYGFAGFLRAYNCENPISPPEKDFDARLALYSLRR